MDKALQKRYTLQLVLYNLLLTAAAACVFLYLYLLRVTGVPFVCGFLSHLHLYCPGCGMSRAVLALCHGDILGSVSAHPFALLGVLLVIYYEVAFLLRLRNGVRPSAIPAIVYACGLLFFFFFRNILLLSLHFDTLGNVFPHYVG